MKKIDFFLFLHVIYMFGHLLMAAEYEFPVFPVDKCPLSKEDWDMRSIQLKCNKTHGYHCVPNRHLTSLIEFCSSQGPKVPIEAGNCVHLAGRGRLNQIPCQTVFSSGCPDTFFFSQDIYKWKISESIDVLKLDEGISLLEKDEKDKTNHQKKIKRIPGLHNRGFDDLHLAAKDGNLEKFIEIWETLSQRNKDNLDSRTGDGRNCLHIAAFFGHFDICSHILRNNKNLFSKKDNNKMNPAHWAALGGKINILKLMMSFGCDLAEKTEKYEENIVLFACIGDWIDVCKFAANHATYKSLLHAKNREGWNPIQYAAKRGYFEIFKFLYTNGVDCYSESFKTGKTCLHTACENGQVDICKFILNKNPDLKDKEDYNHQHAGHFAAKSGSTEILFALNEKADLPFFKKVATDNINILHIACKYGNLNFCKQLENWGILNDLCQDITEKGWNAALFITERCVDEEKRIQILELLTKNGLDVYHVSRAGKTILYNACVNQSKELVKYLLKHFPALVGIERALDPTLASKSEMINAIFDDFKRKMSKRDKVHATD
uniref:Serine/threonine-protein phosphatase 6 regulatory ankyrin repeat subunit B-like isoform X3 n=1 Tax=Crassostrea virginica TaxID=6565 RepID=A0A8B8B3R4_CRAVI|nr:serine/threonine-protein phosphatase 6 regulatory ankyrin repeat subunit B-like isoform X3 [Crassostrea virginica]